MGFFCTGLLNDHHETSLPIELTRNHFTFARDTLTLLIFNRSIKNQPVIHVVPKVRGLQYDWVSSYKY